MLDDPAVRKGLIIGIIASIIGTLLFIAFINPILQAGLSLLQTLSSKAYTELSNSIYKQAALGRENADTFLIVFISFVIASSFITTTIFFRKTSFFMTSFSLLGEGRPKWPLRTVYLLLSLFVNIFLILWLTTRQVSFELNTSFHQRVTVLAPYLSEQEEEELAAMWASMKNRQDYEHTNEQLNNYAQKNNITLPKLLPLAK